MKEDILFKRTPFGGFDRTEVISYIQKLKETQQKYKVMLDEKESLNRKLAEDNGTLSRQVESLKNTVDKYEKSIEETETRLKSLKAKYDMLEKKASNAGKCDEAGKKLAGDTVKMCDELVETASATAKELVKKAEDEYASVQKKVEDVASKINTMKNMPAKDIKLLIKKLADELKK